MSEPGHEVFISYSHDDEKWLARLRTALHLVVREQPRAVWWDGLIKPGQEWREEIRRAVEAAQVGVLLVSPGFLASEFILDHELPVILDGAQSRGVEVLWTLVRNCSWNRSPLARYQAFIGPHGPRMRAWNAMSEAELDDHLKALVDEIALRLAAGPSAPAREDAPVPGQAREGAGVTGEVPKAAPVVPELPSGAAEAPAARQVPAEEQRAHAESLLAGLEDVQTVGDLGDLYVLQRRWTAATATYDRMLELAAPNDERRMAWAYEKLGLIRRQQGNHDKAAECWRLAHVLYRRSGEAGKAEETRNRLSDLAADSAVASRGEGQAFEASTQPASSQS